jgi:hypothetical protein
MATSFEMLQPIAIKSIPDASERLLQDFIANDPSILGLGALELQAKERIQPSGGRLDFILRDEDNEVWYEVEIQLGRTDESHIIRTIEYWESEQRRHPDIQHIAVIVAEEITGRFFNVISLFNQNIPIIALKMTATKLGDKYGLLFTKILHHQRKEAPGESLPVADSGYWEKKAAPFGLTAVREIVEYAKANISKDIDLEFTKSHIGTSLQGQVSNFITFNPRKRFVRISFHCARTTEFDARLDDWGVDWEYKTGRFPRYRLRLLEGEIHGNDSLLHDLLNQSFEECDGEERESAEVIED